MAEEARPDPRSSRRGCSAQKLLERVASASECRLGSLEGGTVTPSVRYGRVNGACG